MDSIISNLALLTLDDKISRDNLNGGSEELMELEFDIQTNLKVNTDYIYHKLGCIE